MLARPVALLLTIAVPAQAVPYPIPPTPFPAARIIGEGGSDHVARARRERALSLRFTLRFTALSRQTTLGAGAPGTPTAPGTIDYTYDTRDRLMTENANDLTYDGNGNLTAKVGEATYTWDHESRLKKVEKTGGTVVEYLYDADGNRVQTKTTPSGGGATTVNYLTDTSGGLSHVVAEVDASTATPALQALYVRGIDDLLSVMRPAGGGGWNSRFFHADGIGSIRRLTNESGTITDGYSYTAFGERLGHTGTDPQPYSFAGEPLDPNSGFQYHRARWMDPGVGRFAGMDPFAGLSSEPSSLHRYLYANADPPNTSDPSGEFALASTLEGALGRLTIAATSLPVMKAVEATITSTLLIAAGLTSAIAVSKATGQLISAAREKIRQEVEKLARQLKEVRILFHYSSKESVEAIFFSGVIHRGNASGPYPPGAYATDIAGWLSAEIMRRSQLVEIIFGRNNPTNYARAAWFVAFAELPKFKFSKIAPFIYFYPGSARIIPLAMSPTLLGE
jgi:RHS repeat-associated protein